MSAIPSGTTLLPASAGTGKTFRVVDVLRELVLDEGHDLQRVVVVTFTEAAAGELRERVRARLVQARDGLLRRLADQEWDPPDEVLGPWVEGHMTSGTAATVAERARRTLVAFDTACITTIHGFCARVLTEAAFEAGAPFATEMLGDTKAVLREVVDDFWVRHTYAAPPATLHSLSALGIGRKAMLHLSEKAADPTLRVVPADPGLTEAVDLGPWQALLDAAAEALHTDYAAVRQIVAYDDAICRRRNKKKELKEAISEGRAKSHLQDLPEWLDNDPVPGQALPPCAREFSTSFLTEATLPGHTTPSHPLFEALQGLIDEQAGLQVALAEWKLSLQHEVVRATRDRLAETLRARNALTFDELLRRVGRPLRDPGLRDRLRDAVRRRYDAAVVDEFQDTDPVQWDIFRELFGDRLFLVGDPKQAIYSFRGADFGTYRRAAGDCDELESLGTSFRSDDHLVKALQHLFARDAVIDPMFDSDIPFPPIQAHHAGTRLPDDPHPPLHIRLLGREGRRLWQYRWLTKGDLQGRLPRIVANDVVRELRRAGTIRGRKQPIGPGDCAVLTRTNDQARAVAHALIARGVPAVVRSDDSVLDSPECLALLHVLRGVREPLRTALVRRALLTDLLGATAARLVELEQDALQWVEVAGRFRRWRTLWDERGVLAMIRALLDEGGVAKRLLAQGRERALTNVRHLGELLQRAAVERRLSPDGLVDWLEDGAPGIDTEDAALRVETDAAAVQCVTVHSAKGLQYPLVWAPWLLGGSWVAQLDQEHLVVHDPDTPGRRLLDLGSARKGAFLETRRKEAFAEDLRLAYVALTRAKHKVTLYWGAGGPRSALAWVVHQRKWMKGRQERWDKQIPNRFYWQKGGSESNLPEDLDALAKHPHIGWGRADWADEKVVERWDPAADDTRPLAAAELSTRVAPDRSWRRTSFTGFVRDVSPHDPHPGVDHDEGEDDTLASEAVVVPGDDPVPTHDLWGSARLGRVLHHVYEVAPPDAEPEALQALLGPALGRENLPAAWRDRLADAVHGSLHTPMLDDGVCLADIPASQRWAELDFHLPLRGGFDPIDQRLTPSRLAEAFEEALGPGIDAGWRDQLRRLTFAPARGFLVGSIDLVFRHGGRWYLADYKSNRLGPDWRDYATDALRAPMYKSLYPLQYHLYAVALLRLLRARVPGFDAERDFGGALYLFVRGMDARRPGHGVFFDRPPVALLQRLDDALGGGQ